MLHKGSTIESYYADETPSDRSGCEVRIGKAEIVVSIKSDGVWLIYSGAETASGHFDLISQDGRGQAILHRSPGANTLEGFWVADGQEGMCRIELGDVD